MSETQQIGTDLDNSFFQAYANKIAADSKQNKGQSNFAPKEYDEIAYAGLETGVNKIYRCVGAPPGAETMGYQRKNYDPKQIMMIDVKDDEGKKFTVKLPLREDAIHNHILHRLYDKVAEVVWINKKKVFVNETKFPELWALITKGNYKPDDGYGYTIAAGYKSTTFTIMNVIDRQDDWCEKNKHTKILCREVNVDAKGTIWPKPGVKSFGFIKRVADLVGKYGDIRNYDISLKRTGDKEMPFDIKNASIYKEKDMLTELKNADGTIPDANIIVIGKLTDTEIAFEKYDLDKLYQPTSYTKLLKRVPALFKLTDACLGTKFFQELESLSEKEKEEWKRIYGDSNEQAENEQATTENKAINEAVKEEKTETPTKRRTAVGPVQHLSESKIALLKGWSKLPEAQKALISDIVLDGENVKNIEWVNCKETETLLACDCGAASPEIFEVCPVCSASFM